MIERFVEEFNKKKIVFAKDKIPENADCRRISHVERNTGFETTGIRDAEMLDRELYHGIENNIRCTMSTRT